MRFRCDIVAGFDEGHLASDLHHVAAQLMADHARGMDPPLCPFIPPIDMGIGSTERGRRDFDHGIVWPRSWVRPISEGEARSRNSFDECFHECILYQHHQWTPMFQRKKHIAPPSRGG